MNQFTWLSKLHRRLLPDNPDIGYTPYLWLFYLLFLLPGLYFTGWAWQACVITIVSVLVFLPLYFRGFWLCGSSAARNCLIVALIGVLLLPVNASASVYFIYASAACGYSGNIRRALMVMVGLAIVLALESWLLGFPKLALLMPTSMMLLIGCANLFHAEIANRNASLRISQTEVSRLAAVAERERISRDLHDLLGHSLSLITLKAELAGKLLQREDIARAEQEVADLENISRTALREVREAVSGYRQAGLDDELQHAEQALQFANISLQLKGRSEALPQEYDNALAMCVREAVTNVIRHAEASSCQISIEQQMDRISVTISDDGPAKVDSQKQEVVVGSGLRGMHDRVTALGGSLWLDNSNGMIVSIQLPLPISETAESSADSLVSSSLVKA